MVFPLSCFSGSIRKANNRGQTTVFSLEASLLVLAFLSQDKPWSVPYYLHAYLHAYPCCFILRDIIGVGG